MKVLLDYSLVTQTENFYQTTLKWSVRDPAYHWISGLFTKVVLGCKDEEELLTLRSNAERLFIPNSLVIDSGLTEFHGKATMTCIGIGPWWSDTIDLVTGHLKLL